MQYCPSPTFYFYIIVAARGLELDVILNGEGKASGLGS
jgi:hypothetical protein